MQHDFLFSSKKARARPCMANIFFWSAQSNFNYCLKVLSMKNILIHIKTKMYMYAKIHVALCQNPCCVGSLLQYIQSPFDANKPLICYQD